MREISWFTAKLNADVYCHLQGRFPCWEGSARERAGCQLPAADTQGALMSRNDDAGSPEQDLSAQLETAAKWWRQRKPRSLLWLPRGWSWLICPWVPGGAESPVNTPWPCFRQTFKCVLGAWEGELCQHAFQGGKSTLSSLCSSALLWLKPGWCSVSSFLRVIHFAVGLPWVLHSAFYRTGEIRGEEGRTDTPLLGVFQFNSLEPYRQAWGKNVWMWKVLPSELNYSSEY